MSTDKSYIQQAIYYLLQDNAFIGSLLQQINICIDNRIPTAALAYDKDNCKFKVMINDDFFSKLTLEQRKGVFFHEILHFTHGHLFRFDAIGTPKDQKLKNIAADMAINQFIKELPEGCVNFADWKDQTGTKFPAFEAMEVYYDLLKQTTSAPEDGNGDEPDDADGEGQGNSQTKKKNGDKNAKGQKGQQANWDKFKQYKEFDQHDWEELSEEEKARLLQEAKRVVTRAVDNAYKDFDNVPDAIKDMLQKIDAQIKALDYKAILRSAIKKTLTTQDRTSDWKRPNKRYGAYAPGSTYDKAPYINIYIDTSGSIGQRELNEFLEVMDGFLKNGSKRCQLGLWHTNLYSLKKYKLKQQFNNSDLQSGGTDVGCVLEHIEKTKPNLSIILTDGYFGQNDINLTQKIVFIISKDGTIEHPHKAYGKTIKMQGLM